MNALIDNIQIIEREGKPEYAVIPYEQFLKLSRINKEPTVPHEVVGLMINEDISIIKAWRKFLGLAQKEVAEKADITPAAMSQIEKTGARPHPATLKKLAQAMDIDLRQLED